MRYLRFLPWLFLPFPAAALTPTPTPECVVFADRPAPAGEYPTGNVPIADATPRAFAPAPPANKVTRLGPVVVAVDASTKVTVRVGGQSKVLQFAGADTQIIPRGMCGAGEATVEQTGAVNVDLSTTWWNDTK